MLQRSGTETRSETAVPRTAASRLEARKNDHIDVVLSGAARPRVSTGLEHVVFEHCALPEIALADIDLSTRFLGRPLAAPLLISSMTGGPARAETLNRRLAEAAQALGIAFAVGSQRIALERGASAGLGSELRRIAPDIPIFANFGAVQLGLGYGPDEALRAVEMVGADALILHFNPLQEALQPEGDRDWSNILKRIEALVPALGVPVIAKEVGSGISVPAARQLVYAGVAAIDIAGAGGTSWALVESARAAAQDNARAARVAATFAGWGIPTAQAIAELAAAGLGVPIIGSGGIGDGLDVARAIRLGANLAGQAAAVLPAALQSTEAALDHFTSIIEELRIACFCTGSRNLDDLARASLVPHPSTFARDL